MRSCLLARPCPTRRPPAAHSTEAGPSGPCPQDVVANTDTPPTYKASRQGGVARLLRTEVPIVSQKNHLGTPALPQTARRVDSGFGATSVGQLRLPTYIIGGRG